MNEKYVGKHGKQENLYLAYNPPYRPETEQKGYVSEPETDPYGQTMDEYGISRDEKMVLLYSKMRRKMLGVWMGVYGRE